MWRIPTPQPHANRQKREGREIDRNVKAHTNTHRENREIGKEGRRGGLAGAESRTCGKGRGGGLIGDRDYVILVLRLPAHIGLQVIELGRTFTDYIFRGYPFPLPQVVDIKRRTSICTRERHSLSLHGHRPSLSGMLPAGHAWPPSVPAF
jgi:hypothetical protein